MHIDFRKMRHITVAADISECPDTDLPEIVLAGRSNSGKSSLINALADRSDLARVSSTPGKTRLVVYFGIDGQLLLADLPGYGFAQASKRVIRSLSGLADRYFQSGRPIRLAIVLLDIRHPPTDGDRMMLDFLTSRSIPFIPVFNKADKLSRAQCVQHLSERRAWLSQNGFHVDSFAISTQSKEGISALGLEIERRIAEV